MPHMLLPLDLVNLIGYFGLACFVASQLVRSPRFTALWQAGGEGFYTLHFLGLSTPLLAVTAAGIFGRNILTAFAPRKVLLVYISLFVLAFWVYTFTTAESTLSYVAAVGLTLSTLGMLFRDNFWRFRLTILVSQAVWLTAFYLAGSEPSIIKNTLCISVNMLYMLKEMQTVLLANKKKAKTTNPTTCAEAA